MQYRTVVPGARATGRRRSPDSTDQDQHATKEAPVADTQDKQIFEQAMAEIFGQGKLEAIGEYVTPDFQEHEEGPGKDRGRDGLTDTVRAVRAAFPDLQVHVEAISEHGDRTWARVRFTGTSTGPLTGHPPTGRAATWTAIDHCRYASGNSPSTEVSLTCCP
jgi:predicted ester cyclase